MEVTQRVIEARKAMMTAARTLNAAGKNYPMIARFVDYVFDQTSLRALGVRTETVTATDTWEVHRVGIGKRVTMAAEEARAPDARLTLEMGKITATPGKFVVPVEASEDFFQYNLDQNAMRKRAVGLFTTALANDLENFAWEANTLGHAVLQSDVFPDGSTTQYIKDLARSKFNGFLRQAESGNVYDAQNAQIGAPLTDAAIRAVPVKYRQNRKLLAAMYSADLDQMYRMKLSGRGTGYGDTALQGENPITIFGLKHWGASLFPHQPLVTRHVQLSGTTAVSLGFKNITDVLVFPSTLGQAVATPYTASTTGTNNDYVLDAENGTIARTSGGTITNLSVVKVTFKSSPQILVTQPKNLVLIVGLDLKIKYDEDIFKDTWQCAIHYKGSCVIENVEATSLVKNVSLSV